MSEDGTLFVPHQVMNNAHSCHIQSMESDHTCRREDLCRVCGCRLQKALRAKGKTGKQKPQYACRSYSKDLMTAFDIDVASDAVEIDPQMFCILCHKAMTRIVRAKECQRPYKCSVQPYNWHTHTLDTCKVSFITL